MLHECLGVLEFFDLAATPGVPWKNGGGSTQELVCWPPGAGMEGFEWRVSVATIATPGPFSAFPGVDRQIMLLEGDGVQLTGKASGWQHTLDQTGVPFAFAGEEPVDCQMLGGTSTDFNLMLRRGTWRGALQVVRSAQSLDGIGAGLCMVLQGAWRCHDGASTRTLAAGQGVWWWNGEHQHEHPNEGRQVVPVGAAFNTGCGEQSAALAWIALEPTRCV
jgi:uncharacterized protein